MIRFHCPACGKSIAVKEEFAGRKGACSGCEQEIRIPLATPALSPAAVRAETSLAPHASSEDAESGEYDFGDDLPELPSKARRHSITQKPDREVHPSRMVWLLNLYAKVNLIISSVIAAPLFLFGVFTLLVSVLFLVVGLFSGKADAATAGGILSGFGLLYSTAVLAGAVLFFMWMNVFTMVCWWGSEVLRLLESRSE